eukprot:Trichotokara_eunicae@DN3051_c0_g1_i2.p1
MVPKGAYILDDFDTELRNAKHVIIGSSGTELHICVEARKKLIAQGVNCRVVSVPCVELFMEQPAEYQKEVLQPTATVKRLYVEASDTSYMEKFFDATFGMTTFGGSGKKSELWSHFGFTADGIAKRANSL